MSARIKKTKVMPVWMDEFGIWPPIKILASENGEACWPSSGEEFREVSGVEDA